MRLNFKSNLTLVGNEIYQVLCTDDWGNKTPVDTRINGRSVVVKDEFDFLNYIYGTGSAEC